MSTKFDRIFKISKVTNATDIEKQVLSALIGCLDGPETCEFLLKTIEGKPTLRNLVLRKINRDLSDGRSNEYKKLAGDLIALAGAPTAANVRRSASDGGGSSASPSSTITRQVVQRPRPPHSAVWATPLSREVSSKV